MRGITLALILALLASLLLTGCGEKPVEPGKNDKPDTQQLRKDKTGD